MIKCNIAKIQNITEYNRFLFKYMFYKYSCFYTERVIYLLSHFYTS